jgi:hypothetical protein
LLSLAFLIRAAEAADLRSFQVFKTVGAGGPAGVAMGATLLEVEQTSEGLSIRYVYAGVIDFACHRTTVMSWHKRLSGRTPRDLAGAARLCEVSQTKLNNLQPNSPAFWASVGTEDDSEAFVVRCGESRRVLNMPIHASPRSPYAKLPGRIVAAAWGEHLPDFRFVDSDAEREGKEFAGIALKWEYEERYPPLEVFRAALRNYAGPVGKPAYDWRVDTGTDLRLLEFVEPEAYALGITGRVSPSFVLPLRLTLDRRSGKVLKSETAVDWNSRREASAVWGASLRWAFEPSTIPDDPIVNVTVHFHANCNAPADR